MNIALCYENVDPARGGCETYIADLARRMVADGHRVHLYACRWHAAALPEDMVFHRIRRARGPRFLRPWSFGRSCLRVLRPNRHDVSIGFDKTWGQDVHYPQGGIYAASQAANFNKYSTSAARVAMRVLKIFDPAVQSFRALERLQFRQSPTIIVNSAMVRGHAMRHFGLDARTIHVVRAAVDPQRFDDRNRPGTRRSVRAAWDVPDDVPVGLFVAMNYRLKGIEPLLRAVALLAPELRFRLVVVGHPRFYAYERWAK